MAYKIPGNIKILCEKENLSDPNEQELVKQELVKFLKDYLDLKRGKNSLANITDIVSKDGEFPVKGTGYPFERDVAGRMMRTRDYTMKEGINKGGKEEVYVIAADKAWVDKHSVLVSVGLLIIGFILGIIGEPVRERIFPKDKTNQDTVSVKLLSTPQQREFENYQKDAQSFTGQVFDIAETYLQDKCTAISQGDCDTSDLFFLTDKTFCLITRCIYNDTYYSGTYSVKDGRLILSFKQTLVSEIVDDQTGKVDNKRKDTKIGPSEYKISSCAQKVRLIHSDGIENGFRRPQTEEIEMIKKLKEVSAWKLLQG